MLDHYAHDHPERHYADPAEIEADKHRRLAAIQKITSAGTSMS